MTILDGHDNPINSTTTTNSNINITLVPDNCQLSSYHHHHHHQMKTDCVSLPTSTMKLPSEHLTDLDDFKELSAICVSCGQFIEDKYYFMVDGSRWHSNCLKCNGCQISLTNLNSCFTKNKKVWCRHDYNKQFRCQKCSVLLQPSDMIIRSGEAALPYHAGCFRCDTCNVMLLAGDQYASVNNLLYCKSDFLQLTNSNNLSSSSSTNQMKSTSHSPSQWLFTTTINATSSNNQSASATPGLTTSDPLSALRQLSMNDYIKSKLTYATNNNITIQTTQINDMNTESDIMHNKKEFNDIKDISYKNDNNNNNNNNNEKRASRLNSYQSQISPNADSKTVSNEEIIDAADSLNDDVDTITKDLITDCNNSLNEASPFDTEEGDEEYEEQDEDEENGGVCDDEDDENCLNTSNTNEHCSQKSYFSDNDEKISSKNSSNKTTGNVGSINNPNGNSLRQKRVRTSFKHQQLRTMKAYFAMNHNPDSKDLRQLSQKTGLSKRVLQVWFQNARAKFRRSLCRQTGVICNGNPAGNGLMSTVFDESLLSIDKNGNYNGKSSKMANFNEMTTSLLHQHNLANNLHHAHLQSTHRLCNLPPDLVTYSGVSQPPNNNNNSILINSSTNIQDGGYLPNGTNNSSSNSRSYVNQNNNLYSNSSITGSNSNNNNSNSPSHIFSMDIGYLASTMALGDYSQDNVNINQQMAESFRLTELNSINNSHKAVNI